MTLHVTGFSTGTDKDGVPTTVPAQIMTRDLPTADDVMSYIRSYTRTLPSGKTFMFSVTGTPDAKADAGDNAGNSVQEPPAEGDAELAAAMFCFDYALNSIGCQLTGLLSTEQLTSWLDDEIYDQLVDAQNRIVRALEWMEGGEQSEDVTDGVMETGASE